MTPPAFTDTAVVQPAFAGGAAPALGAGSWAADLSRLTRPRIAVMVLATVATSFWLTAGRPDNRTAVFVLLAATAAVAASSSIANQILERDSDRVMARTSARPIAA
ncbi:MAG: protoheme IX farnesyltransferase, partial [Planctomycetia bacterium]|nr:protoheme IX farnesyltransferase [Planctomycetia bacterium]